MLKKFMLAGLMSATVLGGVAPAYAQRGEDSWRGRSETYIRGERGRSHGDVQRRGGDMRQQPQAQRWEQRRAERPAIQSDRVRSERQWRGDRRVTDGEARERRHNDSRVVEQRRAERPQWREDRRDVRVDRRDYREQERRDNRWTNDDRRWSGNSRAYHRFNDRTRWNGQRRWNNDWRQDRRYDWYSYRSRYGDRYRLGRYYAPRGWHYGYTRYSIGIFLNSLLFSSSYWIDDPWYYRLPPAYGTLRWIRYHDDALLVDIRDGYVVDVIYDFFW